MRQWSVAVYVLWNNYNQWSIDYWHTAATAYKPLSCIEQPCTLLQDSSTAKNDQLERTIS